MRAVGWFAALLGLVACGGKSDSGQEDEDPAEHACEMVGETGKTLQASAVPVGATSLTVSEVPATVSLVDEGDGTYLGYLTVEIAEETDATLFARTAGVVTGLQQDGADVTLASAGPNSFCPDDIPEHWDLELTPGTWTIELGPSAVDSVWLMLVSSAGHADGE